MKNKYKLIKLYPGSPELGTIAEKEGDVKYTYPNGAIIYESSSTKSLFDTIISCNPEYWKEIVEKDYEILSIYSKINGAILSDSNVNTWESNINTRLNWEIHSVKRLSDGEIFTIGDRIRPYYASESFVIEHMRINNLKQIVFLNDNKTKTGSLSSRKVKHPLFTTEDGIDIYQGDKFYFISKTFNNLKCAIKNYAHNGYWKHEDMKTFSTKEAAEEYIIRNKPCLSLNDVAKIYKTANISINEYTSKKDKNQNHDQGVKLIDLIKEKLNMK